jgi:thiol:disulfide interchange protein DsbD
MRPSALLSVLLFLAALFASSAAAAAPAAPDAFTSALERGPVYAALAALAGGLLVSLTPCVYPMVAVTVSVFGARQTRSRWQGALLSAAFVLGIVAMFVPLGVIAGLTGSMFGSVLQSRVVIVAISALFLLMAASMFGAFELTLPSALTNRLATVGGIGYRGAFLLGLACGLIASPCTGPVLTGILTWIAKTQSALLGAGAMTAFALGLGAPFFVVGTFAVQLPKSGHWMVHVKSLLGIVLLVVAFYFLSTAFPVLSSWATPRGPFLAIMAGVFVVGLLLGAVHRSFDEPGAAVKVGKALGIVLTSVAAFGMLTGATKPSQTLSWEQGSVALVRERAKREGRPLIIDFTAAWCAACKELDKLTFADPTVAREAGRFVAVKVDATNDEDEAVVAAMRDFRVKGLPTVIVYDSSGSEARRYTDFVEADDFLRDIQRVD